MILLQKLFHVTATLKSNTQKFSQRNFETRTFIISCSLYIFPLQTLQNIDNAKSLMQLHFSTCHAYSTCQAPEIVSVCDTPSRGTAILRDRLFQCISGDISCDIFMWHFLSRFLWYFLLLLDLYIARINFLKIIFSLWCSVMKTHCANPNEVSPNISFTSKLILPFFVFLILIS